MDIFTFSISFLNYNLAHIMTSKTDTRTTHSRYFVSINFSEY